MISISMSYLLNKKLQFLEDYIYGSRFPIVKHKNEQIVLVIISDNTIKKIGAYPFKRSEYAKVVASILKGKPKVIGIDIFFDGIKDIADDSKLLDVMSKANSDIVLAIYPEEADNLIINKVKFSPLYNNNNKINVGNVKIFVNPMTVMTTKSCVIPYVSEHEKEYIPFPVVVASKFLNAEQKQSFLEREGLLIATIGNINIEIPFESSYCMLINYIGNHEAFSTIPFEKVLETDSFSFQNKIVLIGATAESIGDNFITPLSKKTPGVVVHANAIHTIISKQFILEAPLQYQVVIIFFVCLVISCLVYFLRPLTSLSISVFVLIVDKIIVDFLFAKYRLYFLYSPLFFSVLLSYLGTFIWIRLKDRAINNAG